MRANRSVRRRLLITASMGGLLSTLISPAAAQDSASATGGQSSAEAQDVTTGADIVVTGSRIVRRSTDMSSSAPVAVISGETVAEKGYAQVGELLKELPSNSPLRVSTPSVSNGQVFLGQDFPNLFNLGPARTLTLVNGRRMPSTTSGLGDEATDTNIIPTGLLERVDVVQGGGAAVYGSGAIGGVVNYVLNQKFSGLKLEAQYRYATEGAYRSPLFRAIGGVNFGDGRGNVAVELTYSANSTISNADRWKQYPGQAIPNPAVGAGRNGIPAAIYIKDGVNFLVDPDGLVVTNPFALVPSQGLQVGGRNLVIDSNGNLATRNMGVPTGQLGTLRGADIYNPFSYNATIVPRIERKVGTLISHYDLTDHVTVYGEFLAARTEATSEKYDYLNSQFMGPFAVFPRLSPLPFTRTNPYLSAETIAQLSAANPGFAAGQPLYLSKAFTAQPSKYADARYKTEVLRGVIGIKGDFSALNREFFWDLSYSRSRVKQRPDAYHMAFPMTRNAMDTVRNSAGEIVCAINNPVVTDPACRPINIFGSGPIDEAALEYIYEPSGDVAATALGQVFNNQHMVLATLSGDLIRLPGGDAKFGLTYEYRNENAKFIPLPGDQAGIFFSGLGTKPGSGSYSTNEFAAEVEIPIVGDTFKLPLVESLDFNGSYRYVKHSLAGADAVWGVGLRWGVGAGLRLRASRSRNFRAPSIAQLAGPLTVQLGRPDHPCSNTIIGGGPAPATRAANCLALFAANPGFGSNTLPAGVADTPANRLANFITSSVGGASVSTSGNPDLRNEVADTTTFGAIFEPKFIPGLAISADVLRLKLKDGISLFGPNNFANACFDTSPQPAEFCSEIGYNAIGQISRVPSRAVNAGSSVLHAEIVNVDYRLPLNRVSATLPGTLNLVVQATHNSLQTVTVAGTTTRTDGTIALPKWSGRFDARYRNGPFGMVYSMFYLPSALLTRTSTAENSPDGVFRVGRNVRHDISAEYNFDGGYTFRAGVSNLSNKMPSYPTLTYGDIIGRSIFVSASWTGF